MTVVAITYPLSLPSAPAAKRTRFQLNYLVGFRDSQFSGVGQAQDWGGRFWTAEVVLPVMGRAVADEWIAWAAKLRGRSGYFLMGDWDRRAPRGSVSGTPTVNGGGQSGNSLAVKGLTPSGDNLFRVGDHVQVENRLYVVVANVSADSAGQADVQIEPELRSAPADNAPVTYQNPKGLFRLSTNGLPWDSDEAGAHAVSFTAMEKL